MSKELGFRIKLVNACDDFSDLSEIFQASMHEFENAINDVDLIYRKGGLKEDEYPFDPVFISYPFSDLSQ